MKNYVPTEKFPTKAQAYQLVERMGFLFDGDPDDVVREYGEVGDYLVFPETGEPFFMKKDIFEMVYKVDVPLTNSYTWSNIPLASLSFSGPLNLHTVSNWTGR